MEGYIVVGIEFRSYVSKRTNTEVSGYNIYCTAERKGVSGVATESFWVNPDVLAELGTLSLGDKIIPMYNRFGRVVSLRFA